MDDEENKMLLYDRIEVIKTTNKKYDLENNAYLSFSGGKDSTILHYLLDLALPNNRIPRVFINTGIEYNYIVDFVKKLASNDDRFIILQPTIPIKQTLKKYGYPFKSKEHSYFVKMYQNTYEYNKSVRKYLALEKSKKEIKCPNNLKYQFKEDFKINISDKCCLKMKKEPAKKWAKGNNRSITLTGMRKEEGGQRMKLQGCAIIDNEGHLLKFHPLLVVNDEFEEWFINEYSINLCKLYYEPFNFKRTGCKGCPFSLDLQEQLALMEKYLPNERKQCEFIWKPVYDEYRRINYRLKSNEQLKLF